ncbi:MAG: phosphoglycerate kinase [Patescibacteria group bacterium]
MKLPVVDDSIKNKRVLIRGDLDTPVDDYSRLEAIWPTVEFLLKNGNTVILSGHIGRPEGKFSEQFSTKRIAEWFAKKELMSSWIDGGLRGFEIDKNFVVLENLRFFAEEENNDEGFTKELAGLGEIYVNESFANCERAHASMVGVPKLLPHFAGFRLAKEIEVLSGVLENPGRPLLVIIGGTKVETKQPLIDKMEGFADVVVIGGKLATEEKDFLIESLPGAKTIVWNGPMGDIENGYEAGTRKLVDLILAQKEAFKIVGGGDTVGYINKLGMADKFDWVSTGGGSMLKFLCGEVLPGLEALL